MIRADTPVSPDVEAVVKKTIGCAMEVHRQLGPGLRPGSRTASVESCFMDKQLRVFVPSWRCCCS